MSPSSPTSPKKRAILVDRTVTFRHNLQVFIHTLRKLGFKLGPSDYQDAIKALTLFPISSAKTVHDVFSTLWVTDAASKHLFDEVFNLLWREHQGQMEALRALSAKVRPDHHQLPTLSKRFQSLIPPSSSAAQEPTWSIQRAWTQSPRHIQRNKLLESISMAEYNALEAWTTHIRHQSPPQENLPYLGQKYGKMVDWRSMLREQAKRPDSLTWLTKSFKTRRRKLTWIVDVSGSMEHHIRDLLLAICALKKSGIPQEVFLFSSSLERIDPHRLKDDPDDFLQYLHAHLSLIGSGTHLSDCIHLFNHTWLRKIGASHSDLILVTDGLDAAYHASFSQSIFRLKSAFHAFVWANPLLSFPNYTPKAQAAKILAQFANAHLPFRHTKSLTTLLLYLRQ